MPADGSAPPAQPRRPAVDLGTPILVEAGDLCYAATVAGWLEENEAGDDPDDVLGALRRRGRYVGGGDPIVVLTLEPPGHVEAVALRCVTEAMSRVQCRDRRAVLAELAARAQAAIAHIDGARPDPVLARRSFLAEARDLVGADLETALADRALVGERL